MIISSGFLAVMVTAGLVVTVAAPALLIFLWIKDWKKGQLW